MEPELKEGELANVREDGDEITIKQLKFFSDTTLFLSLHLKCPDIELKQGEKYHIVGKVMEKKF